MKPISSTVLVEVKEERRWDENEKLKFMQAAKLFGKNFTRIAEHCDRTRGSVY